MAHRDIIVIGASAGGIEALKRLIKGLPPTLDAAVFVTVHFPEHGVSVLPQILARTTPLTVVAATDGDAIVPGRLYVAPPDHHLLLTRDRVQVVRGPKENGYRPAIDPMFRSASIALGPRVIGVVLTGNLDDGTSGLAAIKRAGGIAVVQDPEEAPFPSMPLSAIERVAVDCVVTIAGMAAAITQFTHDELPKSDDASMPDDIKENEYAKASIEIIEDADGHPGHPSAYGCPDCGGVLWRLEEGEITRFRCRVGHAWTANALLGRQAEAVDEAFWVAFRALEERAALSRQIANRYQTRGSTDLAARFRTQAEFIESRAAVLRNALLLRDDPVDATEASPAAVS